MEQWQLDHVWPHGGTGGATGLTDQLQLGELLARLEYRFPGEQFSQDAAENNPRKYFFSPQATFFFQTLGRMCKKDYQDSLLSL